MFICQNSEGVHPYLLKCWKGTCSFVGMLKGYMVRKWLGTPALKRVSYKISKRTQKWLGVWKYMSLRKIHF